MKKKKYVRLFEEFVNVDIVEWAIDQATSYADTFNGVSDEDEDDEDETENYDIIMSVVNRFEANPQSLTDKEYSDMLYWIANANYEELGEAEYSWEPLNYNDFIIAAKGLKDEVGFD